MNTFIAILIITLSVLFVFIVTVWFITAAWRMRVEELEEQLQNRSVPDIDGKLLAFSQSINDLIYSTKDSIGRIESRLAGSASKGAAGESILRSYISAFPGVETEIRLNNRIVEFGLRLRNGLLVPIDSKWPASNLIEQYKQTPTRALKESISGAVLAKTEEVQKYLIPGLTTSFGIAVIPDEVFAIADSAVLKAAKSSITIIPISLSVQFLLVVSTLAPSSQGLRGGVAEAQSASLEIAEGELEELMNEIESRMSRGLVMLANSRDSVRARLQKISSSLQTLR